MPLLTGYHGCAGTVDFSEPSPFSLWHLPSTEAESATSAWEQVNQLHRGSGRLVQWHSTSSHETYVEQETALLLAGVPLSSLSKEEYDAVLARQLLCGEPQDVVLQGDCAGACVGAGQAVFFKTLTSNHTIFYSKDGTMLRWSTNPYDLLDGQEMLRQAALSACCGGEDAFVYQSLSWVPAGHGVVITPDQTTMFPLGRELLPAFPTCRRLSDWAELAFTVICEVTRPLAASGQPVGVLLSGGMDSSALAAALVENGGEVIGYHLWFDHPAANEAAYAEAVCQRLRIPLRSIRATTGKDYLSRHWRFSHPYGHPGYRWFEQVAEQMAHDRVRLLVTGRYGDAVFGPQERYGLCDILTHPLPLRDKSRMAFHLLSTNWTLPDLLRSLTPRGSLIDTTTLTRSERRGNTPRRADFLLSWEDATPRTWLRYSDFAQISSLDFSPQDLAVEDIWRRSGIHVFHPYGSALVQAFSSKLPAAYRLLPHQGQKVSKPVLRLAFAHLLPACVLRRLHGTWLSAPSQQFCLSHRAWLEAWLTGGEALVTQMELICAEQLRQILHDPRALRANHHSIIATAMVESYLRQLQHEGKLRWL